ncbi:MAG: alpha/beta hydrolase [Leptolinea sp.]|nr:alpha/beta hydrolase [Leptolinea sp.]
MPEISIQTGRIYLLDPSPENKPAIFLLHGLGTEASSWIFQIAALEQAGFRPVAPDLPGFGRSTYTGRRWTIRDAAKSILQIADALTINKFHIVGISMGGTIALQTAIEYSDRLLGLILINTFATLRPKRWNEWSYLVKRYLRARFHGAGAQAEMTARRIFPREDQKELRRELEMHIRQTDPGVYKSAMRELGLFDARHSLKQLSVPSLLITGENDTTVPLENQCELGEGLSGCRQVMIANAGHGVIIDQPDAVNDNLLKFLQTI